MTPCNRKGFVLQVCAGAAVLALALSSAVMAQDHHVVMSPDALNWGPAPPAFPKGLEMAVIVGDPGTDGPFVVRAKMPAGYKVPPHTHPGDENLTVLSGALHMGMGDKFDETKGTTIKAGGFALVPKGMAHFVWFTEPTVLQVHGVGPVAIDYINPADDPRKK